MPQNPKTYEGLFLFGTAFTANADEAVNITRGIIEKHGGKPLVLKKWDDRKLAYEIMKQQRGLYVLAFFEAPTAAITAIDRDCRLSDDVVRAMILDGSHLSIEEVEAMTPERPEPRQAPRRDDFIPEEVEEELSGV
jgi:small subunit ribosomal protein S6